MRNFVNVVLALASVSFLAVSGTDAMARKVSIGGTHSPGDIKKACDAVGGVYEGADSKGHYGCANLDKGTEVNCNSDGKCSGTVPSRTVPRGSIVDKLHGGKPVSASGGSGTTHKPRPGVGSVAVGTRKPARNSGPSKPSASAGAAGNKQHAVVRDHRHDSSGFDGDVHDHRSKHGGIQEGSGRRR